MDQPSPRLRIARLIWGGCLGALLGYYAILVLLVPRELTGLHPELALRVRSMLLPFAGAATIFAVVVYRRLAESANAALGGEVRPRVDQQRALVPYVICWALGDAIALLGLVVGLLGGALGTASVFFLWALGLLLVTRPQPVHFPPQLLGASASSPLPGT
jgi:hypothetical protein